MLDHPGPSCKLPEIHKLVVAAEKPTLAAFPLCIMKSAAVYECAQDNSALDRWSGILWVHADGLETGLQACAQLPAPWHRHTHAATQPTFPSTTMTMARMRSCSAQNVQLYLFILFIMFYVIMIIL